MDSRPQLTNALNNLGVTEATDGNLKEAISLFSRAEKIRARLGKPAVVSLAVTHMTTGRALFLQKDYSGAIARYKSAEEIFLDKYGADGHFMAQ